MLNNFSILGNLLKELKEKTKYVVNLFPKCIVQSDFLHLPFYFRLQDASSLRWLAILIYLSFQVMRFFATAEHEKERLQYFASPEGRDDLYQYNQRERRTVLEVKFFELLIHICFVFYLMSIFPFHSLTVSALHYALFHENTLTKELVQTLYKYEAFFFFHSKIRF